MHLDGYWFKSDLFQIEQGEDEETNPYIYGKQLSGWIASKYRELGYDVEDIIPEDWGWCVMCSRKPYRLWIGCTNQYKDDAQEESIIWSCFPVANVPFWKWLFYRKDVKPSLEKLNEELYKILAEEKNIHLIEEPE